MHVEEDFQDGWLILRVSGELDLQTAASFRAAVDEALARHRCRQVVVNLKKVTFMDSSGLGALLSRFRTLAQRQGRMVLVGPQPQVQAVLEMAGVRRLIPIFPSEQKALAG